MDVIREVKDGNDLTDPFEKTQKEKGMKKTQQKINEMRNQLIKKGVDPKKLERPK